MINAGTKYFCCCFIYLFSPYNKLDRSEFWQHEILVSLLKEDRYFERESTKCLFWDVIVVDSWRCENDIEACFLWKFVFWSCKIYMIKHWKGHCYLSHFIFGNFSVVHESHLYAVEAVKSVQHGIECWINLNWVHILKLCTRTSLL